MTLERAATQWVVHLEGECSMASASELRGLLGEGLNAEAELVVDLEAVEQIDVAVLQVLWSAGREAERRNRKFLTRVPAALEQAAREAGFARFPGAAIATVPAATAAADSAEG